MRNYLRAVPGYRQITKTKFAELMELDTFSSKKGLSRYLFDTSTGDAFVDLCGGHVVSLSDYLSMKLGQIILNDANGIKIGWYGEDRDTFLSDGSFFVEDIRFDSEVVWSVALTLCTTGRR